MSAGSHENAVCIDCERETAGLTTELCKKSHRRCGHHCNHSWSHDKCCWCQRIWGEASLLRSVVLR